MALKSDIDVTFVERLEEHIKEEYAKNNAASMLFLATVANFAKVMSNAECADMLAVLAVQPPPTSFAHNFPLQHELTLSVLNLSPPHSQSMHEFASAIKTMGGSKLIMLLRGLCKQNDTVHVRSISLKTSSDNDDYISNATDEDSNLMDINDSIPRNEMLPKQHSIPGPPIFDVPFLSHLSTDQAEPLDESPLMTIPKASLLNLPSFPCLRRVTRFEKTQPSGNSEIGPQDQLRKLAEKVNWPIRKRYTEFKETGKVNQLEFSRNYTKVLSVANVCDEYSLNAEMECSSIAHLKDVNSLQVCNCFFLFTYMYVYSCLNDSIPLFHH